MNAAARLFSQSTVSRTWLLTVLLEKAQYGVYLLILAVLLSALSMVYVTNSSRSLNAELQQSMAERNHLHIQWGQLLLEKSTWTMQARVQQVASDKLGMMVPEGKSLIIIHP